MHRAAIFNQLKVAQLLIDNGADKNIKDTSGRKPIDRAYSSEMKQVKLGFTRACRSIDKLGKKWLKTR